MSNDTHYALRFCHEKKRYLEQVREFAQEKLARWNELQANCKDVKAAMKRVGAKQSNEVFSWGFDFGKIQKHEQGYCLLATASANQSSWSLPFAGEDGELAGILARFPELNIEGEFADEYGRGSVNQIEQAYETMHDDAENAASSDDGKLNLDELEFAAVHYVRLDVEQLVDPVGTVLNSIGMKLVPIPAGEFMMGGRDDEEGYNPDEEHLHRVTISRPFLMGMFQVTQGEYTSLMGKNPSVFHGKTRPVEHVSWLEAADFCRQLSELKAEQSAGRSYRLPTEAEWEYACRAGTTTAFAFGAKLTRIHANFCESMVDRPQPTYPVGMFAPNAWNLFDMHGNVWEWCQDWYSQKYYLKCPAKDPTGPSKGKHHVLRGGSASVLPHECRSAMRGEARSDSPNPEGTNRFEVYGDFGFRVVCEQ